MNIYVKFIFVSFILLCIYPFGYGQTVGDSFGFWQKGYLDIHHINTGKGDATFFILPDGTTMLIDAGEHNRPPGPREVDAKPNSSQTAGTWISRYILNMLKGRQKQSINYMLITHFHSDHMGGIYPGIQGSKNGPYKLSGVTDVGDQISFDKIIDRAWPDYNWPIPLSSNNESIENYRKFTAWQFQENGVKVERFLPGRNDQIVLRNKPKSYPEFEIRNIVANGTIWTGSGTKTRELFPKKKLNTKFLPTENMCSLAIRLSYGLFDYYTGGDMPGIPPIGSPKWMDIESPVANIVGPVDVHVLNHHGFVDAGNANFIKTLRPRINIIQSWVASHPAQSTLSRLLSTNLYSGSRDIFATNIKEETKIVIGKSIDKLKSQQGHIVIRVLPEGGQYYIYILDDSSEKYIIKNIFGPYESK